MPMTAIEKQVTQEIRSRQLDVVSTWLADRTRPAPGQWISTARLHADYLAWIQGQGDLPGADVSLGVFTKLLKALGHESQNLIAARANLTFK